MKLYGHPMSNHSLRVQALLEEFKVPYDLHIVDFEKQENHSEEYLEMNPNAKVPVIDDDGYILWESHAIMRYLCGKYERDDWYPNDYKERAHVDKWLDWCHTRLNPEAVIIAFNTFRNTGEEERIAAAKEDVLSLLPIIEDVFKSQPYLCGRNMNIADLSLLSSIMYLDMCDAGLKKFPETRKWYEKNFSKSTLSKVLPAKEVA